MVSLKSLALLVTATPIGVAVAIGLVTSFPTRTSLSIHIDKSVFEATIHAQPPDFASLAFNSNKPHHPKMRIRIFFLQEYIGHRNVKATKIYI